MCNFFLLISSFLFSILSDAKLVSREGGVSGNKCLPCLIECLTNDLAVGRTCFYPQPDLLLIFASQLLLLWKKYEESFKHENLTFDADISQSKVDMNAELDAHTLMKSRTSSKLLIRTLSENTQIHKDRYKYTNWLKCEITKMHIAYGKGKIEQS